MATTRQTPASEQVNRTSDVLQELNALFESGRATDAASDNLLEQLYALSKSPNGPELASSIRGSDVALLGHYGFDSNRSEARNSALRCLNNILVLAPPATKLFVDAGLLGKAIDMMRSGNVDDEFLATRLLLLCSAHAAPDLLPYLRDGDLARAVNANMACHAATPSLEPTLACTVNIQLLSVLAAKHEAHKKCFFESLAPLIEIFAKMRVPLPPLEPPMSLVIDSLAVLPSPDEPIVQPGEAWPPFDEEKLVRVLGLAMETYQDGDLELRCIPLISLLYYIARDGPEETKERLRVLLLPSDQDRAQPLGRGSSLPHSLVRVSTGAVTPTFKKALAQLLLELSAGDPRRLVRNVGFGCGIGLLRALGIQAPPPGDVDDGKGTGTGSSDVDINPITGQRRDMEAQPALPEMTGEEREREAERLFVLFERLRATGVVDVENPVSAAARSGQIQEINSDTDED